MLKIRRLLSVSAAMALGHAASLSPAAVPRVLDVLPTEGVVALLAVNNLTATDARFRRLLRAARGESYSGIRTLLETLGLRDGIDLSGSAAILLMRADPPDAHDWIAVIPVGDSEAFFRQAGATNDAGMRSFDFAGVAYHARTIADRYIALGPGLDSIRAFDGAAGRSKLREASAGAIGQGVLNDADLVAIVDPSHLADALAALMPHQPAGPVDRALDGMRAAVADRAGTGGSFLDRLARLVSSESRSLTLGLTFDEGAARLDIASAFVPDGVLASAASSSAEDGHPPAPALSIMPDEPYLFAAGVDAAHHAVRTLMDELALPARTRSPAAEAEKAAIAAVESMEALAIVAYAPPSVMFGGLSRTVVGWRSPAPEQGVASFRTWVESLNGRPLGTGSISASYDAAQGVVARDSWTITPPNGSMPMLGVLMGPVPDVRGTTLRFADRAYLTWTRDTGLVNRTARDDREPLTRAASVKHWAAALPSPRVIEVYLELGPIVKQLAPLTNQHGDNDDLPDSMPPIAASLHVRDGSAGITVLVPKEVLNAAHTLTRTGPGGPKGR